VPRACDLGQVVPQLAALRCYEGVVDLPLAKAAALDPDRLARLPGEQGRGAREARPRRGVPGPARACPALPELRRRRRRAGPRRGARLPGERGSSDARAAREPG